MSNNRHKNLMCNICGKVMRDDHLKRHMNSKHGNVSGTLHHGEEHPQYMNFMVDGQYKSHDENESQVEHCKNEETCDLPVSCDAKLKFKLYRDNEVYQKNVKTGEQISILLKSDNILLKSNCTRKNRASNKNFRNLNQHAKIKL